MNNKKKNPIDKKPPLRERFIPLGINPPPKGKRPNPPKPPPPKPNRNKNKSK
ncbi:MAG: hypothetical protein HQ591_08835 [candidate division Zixibacteria bacterium]|nr:hypothetical protein [Candidatus Tariuqbacter arcticus]